MNKKEKDAFLNLINYADQLPGHIPSKEGNNLTPIIQERIEHLKNIARVYTRMTEGDIEKSIAHIKENNHDHSLSCDLERELFENVLKSIAGGYHDKKEAEYLAGRALHSLDNTK